MSSVGEGDTIVRHPDLLNSLVDAARDPVAAAANVAEFQALLSPLGRRAATRIQPDELRRLAVRTLMIWGGPTLALVSLYIFLSIRGLL
jgi:hypothetical protein